MVRSGVTSNHEDARRDLTCAARATRRRFMRTIRADGYTKGGGPIGDGSGGSPARCNRTDPDRAGGAGRRGDVRVRIDERSA